MIQQQKSGTGNTGITALKYLNIYTSWCIYAYIVLTHAENQDVSHKLHNTLVFCSVSPTPSNSQGNLWKPWRCSRHSIFEDEEHINAVQSVPSERGQQEVLKQSCKCCTGTLIWVLVMVWLRNYVLTRQLCHTQMLDGVVYAEDEEKVENRHAHADVHH